MSVFVTLHDSINADDVEDVLLMAIDSWASKDDATAERVAASYGNFPAGWTAKRLPASVLLFNVPTADAALVRAAAAFGLGGAFRLDVFVDENWNIAQQKAYDNDDLNFYRTEQLLTNGFPRPASVVAGVTRRYLQSRGRPFPASLAESIRWCMLLSDCIEQCRTPVFPESGNILCNRGIDTDLTFFLSAHLDSLSKLIREQPGFNEAMGCQLKFMTEGASLAKVAFRPSKPQYAIFAWLSIYLLRLSYSRYSVNDTAEAVALLVRSLECYSTYYLAEVGVIHFESGSFVWTIEGTKVLGAGELWGELLKRIDGSVKSALLPAIAAAEAVIKLRNRSIYGHGVQKVTRQVFESHYSEVRRMLGRFEEDDPVRHARWTKLWELSQPPLLSVLRSLVSKALGEFQRHGEPISA